MADDHEARMSQQATALDDIESRDGAVESLINHFGSVSLAGLDRMVVHELLACDHEKTKSPVSRVPEEIIALIMHWATSEVAAWEGDSWIATTLPEWLPSIRNWTEVITLSCVCRSWRAVALTSATLWSCPFRESSYASGATYPFVLERAGGAPLTFALVPWKDFDAAEDMHDQYHSLAEIWSTRSADLMTRIQHLWLHVTALPMEDMLPVPAPLLESMYVTLADEHCTTALPREAPRLRTLVLDDLDLQGPQLQVLKDSPLFPRLTRLAIGFQVDSTQSYEDVVDLLGIIERAPLLQEMVIRFYFRTWSGWGHDRQLLRDKVVFSQLSRLTIHGDQLVVVNLLNNLQLPEHLELCLDPTVDWRDPDMLELEAQWEFVKSFLSVPAHSPVKLVVAEANSIWNTIHSIRLDLYRADDTRVLALPVQVQNTEEMFVTWMDGLVNAMPSDLLTEVHVYIASPPDCLLQMALRIPRLESLYLGSDAIQRVQDVVTTGVHSSPFLSALHKLVVHPAHIEHVQSLLQVREAAGPTTSLEILILELHDCRTPRATIQTVIEAWKTQVTTIRVMNIEACT
jgi:hypothetical protein